MLESIHQLSFVKAPFHLEGLHLDKKHRNLLFYYSVTLTMPKASSRSFSCSSPISDHNLSLLWNIWKYHPNHFQSSLASFFFRGSQNCGLLSKRWFWTSSLLWLPSQKGRLLVCLQLQNHTYNAVKRIWTLYHFKSYHLFWLWRYILHWASFNKFPEVEILW